MQSGLRWSRSHSRRRFPVVGTPYAPPSARPCGYRGTVALVRRCALCAWSVACGQSCGVCPRPPLCFAAARHQPCALVCPSAPRGGSLSPRALVVGFCYKFSSSSRTEYAGYRPKRPVSQRDRWLIGQVTRNDFDCNEWRSFPCNQRYQPAANTFCISVADNTLAQLSQSRFSTLA